jgi:hypothetical protein
MPNRVGDPARHGGSNLNDHVAASYGRPMVLNPAWLEGLMGFPVGWTECEHSETQ